jgi:hypothetical protein
MSKPNPEKLLLLLQLQLDAKRQLQQPEIKRKDYGSFCALSSSLSSNERSREKMMMTQTLAAHHLPTQNLQIR